ncbi:GNAT family N-acetyltransferase [Deinococcus sp.]|uniref:GNAT family N-acetyltransferase n=1 Tax=Deinococcus sp. TaxID=47478 RepID=UPI003C7C8562
MERIEIENLAVQIRAARLEDAGIITRHRYPGEMGEHLAVYEDWLPTVFIGGVYLGWLAQSDGRVIGGAGLLLINWQPSRTDPHPLRGRVVNVFVEPDFRGRGVARSLMQTALAEARRLGLSTLNLGTSEQGRPLYASLGFQAAATEMWLKIKTEHGLSGDSPASNRIP